MKSDLKKVELLAPAGSFAALKCAIANGANAIYMAGKSFGARAFANNFDNDELVEAIKYAHSFGVKVYITVNTLIFENEIDDVISFLDFIYQNDADAVIVQDLGLASIIKHRYPQLDLHASTQMNVQTLEEAKVLKKLGFKRIVLGREVSIKDIKYIKDNLDIEIEVFAHGALCISYSGNCLMSSLIGERSGNRGKCAQPCRMEYKLNGENKYYLSTKDLCTIYDLHEIIPYVDSLKIEGRMKGSAYVGVVTNMYKSVIDGFYKNEKVNIKSKMTDLKITFNREFTKGFILNEKNSNITNCNSQNHLGELVGEIIEVKKNNEVAVKLNNNISININDGLRIVGKNTVDAVIVNDMYINHKLVKRANSGQIVNIKVHKRLSIGDKVYITKSTLVEEKYNTNIKVKINGKCYLGDDKLWFVVTDGVNTVKQFIETEESENNFKDRIKEQLSKINDTIFEYNKLEVEDIFRFVRIKEVNELRRNVINELLNKKINFVRNDINYSELQFNESLYNIERTKKINVIVSNDTQLETVLDYDYVNEIYIRDYKLYDLYKDNKKVKYYLPRITKRCETNAVTSNLGNLKNNYSSVYLNCTNSYSVRKLYELGVKKIGLSPELSIGNIEEIIDSFKEKYNEVPNLEMMIYGRYQAMIMKHCFINKALGYDKKGCNACLNGVTIIDREGKEYPVLRDENCNIAILYYKAVNLFEDVDELFDIGVNNFVIDFTVESEEEIRRVMDFKFKGSYKGHLYSENI